MKRIGAIVLFLVFNMNNAVAQPVSPVALAQAAREQFAAAHAQLEAADGASNRVKALSNVIRAYEEGLEAMRAGLRQISLREAELSEAFEDESGQVAALLGVLVTLQPDATPEALVHPTGPLGRARAGMLVSSVTPAMQEAADVLRVQLQEATILRELQDEAVATLSIGLKDAQQARTELSQAMSDRVGLPKRFVTDNERLRILIESSETLESFASGLAVMDVVDGVAPLPDFGATKGTWPMPVRGRILRGFNEADAAGVARPGVLVATRQLSLVTSPWPATVRYHGAFLDYGNVMILEPSNDVLLVLAGLEEVYGEIGEVIPEGAAIGLMGGVALDLAAFVENAEDGTGAGLSETLYIEVREGGQPVDPAVWFTQ
ncbi:Septal ring factor EnvC, activator of murein hydrolases AmiA and AmiB [Celeribacter marinus]|uniref:Peptidase, M23/M37 family n=2 Tax=Celeribacter marinus TaxID=1397108 RepID=A0A0P0AA55_9RHOB|nr:peptidase, M23/M37 family [Celeribacter marinus]SFK24370.1 Septal ring factor EnvC, activator of murein hydrolases AmiA and AmiB [Celeribacter marinus]